MVPRFRAARIMKFSHSLSASHHKYRRSKEQDPELRVLVFCSGTERTALCTLATPCESPWGTRDFALRDLPVPCHHLFLQLRLVQISHQAVIGPEDASVKIQKTLQLYELFSFIGRISKIKSL
jgi:hypothetical protein